MKVTNQDLPVNMFGERFKDYPDNIVIPKGTRTTHQTACGHDPNYNFIDDLNWISEDWPFLRHDAHYYGLNVPEEYLEEKP